MANSLPPAAGSFTPNQKGLFDLAGNVAEWTHDFYGSVGLGGNVPVDPMGPETGESHTIRGSSWAQAAITEMRLSYRDFGAEPRYDVGVSGWRATWRSKHMQSWLLKLLLLAAVLGFGVIQAQDQQQDGDAAAQQQQQEQTEEEAAESQDEASAEAEEDGEEEEFVRFEPTEQVSRDLGVSFPADI